MERAEARRLAARLRAIAAGESIEDLARRAQAGDEAAYDQWLAAVGEPGDEPGSYWVTVPGPSEILVKKLVKMKSVLAREAAARNELFAVLAPMLGGMALTSGMKVKA